MAKGCFSNVRPAKSGGWWWAEPGALDGEKYADVGERRALCLVAAPALTHQVIQLTGILGSDTGR